MVGDGVVGGGVAMVVISGVGEGVGDDVVGDGVASTGEAVGANVVGIGVGKGVGLNVDEYE